MATFAKAFRGVKDGEIYPTVFSKGDECPKELEQAAVELGALEVSEPPQDPEDPAELEQAAVELQAPEPLGKKKNGGK